MRHSIRAQRGRARSALFSRVAIKTGLSAIPVDQVFSPILRLQTEFPKLEVRREILQFRTRQKGLQSNSGPMCFFVFVAEKQYSKTVATIRSSYIGQFLTAADRCKNQLKLEETCTINDHFGYSHYKL